MYFSFKRRIESYQRLLLRYNVVMIGKFCYEISSIMLRMKLRVYFYLVLVEGNLHESFFELAFICFI